MMYARILRSHWNPLDDRSSETLNPEMVLSVLRDVRERIEHFDQTYSRFRADSMVTQISQRAGSYMFPIDAIPLMAFYRELYDATNGAVTPLIGNVLSDAGYDAQYSLIEKPMTSPKAWDDVMVWNPAACELTVREPVLLDFGAAGKGYCVDIVANILQTHGIGSFLIDAGGDICHRSGDGSRQSDGGRTKIGLENPSDTSQVIGIAIIANQSICGSAGNRRRWGRFHHTIDPRTLESPNELAAVWVVAPSTMLADGVTTALQFTLPEHLACLGTFEYAVLDPRHRVMSSSNFPGEFFEA